MVLLNKCDVPGAEDRRQWLNEVSPLEFPQLVISAREQTGLEELREAVFQSLDVVRIYTKMPHAREPDYDKPFTIARGGTLQQVAELIHKDVASNLKHARVWGSQVHDGTSVKGDYVLADRDVVEIHV
jgi:ribosome-interacting GTPase 1